MSLTICTEQGAEEEDASNDDCSQKNRSIVPVMARLLKVEQMTELEKLFTLELPEGAAWATSPGSSSRFRSLASAKRRSLSAPLPAAATAPLSCASATSGDVTNAMHQMEPGDVMGIRGPFGHCFPIDKMKGKDILFAAGGLGLAPLRSLINQVLDQRGSFGRVIILYGTKHPSEILFQDELEEWAERDDVEFHMTVDRGDDDWTGNVGVITTLFPKITINPRNTVAATCGPPIMYRFVLMELLGKGIPETQIYLSLERRMKCGVGKCGHCQINELYCCQDGPVFSYADIKGLEEAL